MAGRKAMSLWTISTWLDYTCMKASPLQVGALSTAEAVKECLEDLIAVHDRARGNLKIESIEADGLIVTIHTEQLSRRF